jgi:hypothetical protein
VLVGRLIDLVIGLRLEEEMADLRVVMPISQATSTAATGLKNTST